MQGGGADVGVEILPLASFAWKPSMPSNALVGNSPEQLLSTREFALIICGSSVTWKSLQRNTLGFEVCCLKF